MAFFLGNAAAYCVVALVSAAAGSAHLAWWTFLPSGVLSLALALAASATKEAR